MEVKKRLVELQLQADIADNVSKNTTQHREFIADLMIAIGVTIPVRCKDCKFGEMCSIREAMACTDENGFCWRGERRTGGR